MPKSRLRLSLFQRTSCYTSMKPALSATKLKVKNVLSLMVLYFSLLIELLLRFGVFAAFEYFAQMFKFVTEYQQLDEISCRNIGFSVDETFI